MNKADSFFKYLCEQLTPPKNLKIADWADEYRQLSSESSAEPGQWRTSRAEYQREIMNAICAPGVETVVVMSSSQVGKSEVLLNSLGYFIHYDPAPILLLQPTLEMAQAFSKDRISAMVRDTPVLRDRVDSTKAKNSSNTILHKTFKGGHVTLVGANSAAGLASRPVRIVMADEVDRFPVSAGSEGDPLRLAVKRTATFWNRKLVFVSTPTIKGESRIEQLYEDSSRERYYLECPACGEPQILKWANIDFDSLGHVCEACGAISEEFEWKRQPGGWIADNPDNTKVRGFHLNELYSPWKRWSEVIEDFRSAKHGGPEQLKVWVNTALGQTWEEEGEKVDEDKLQEHAHYYNCQVPDRVLILTAGIDVQDDRLEVEVVGWGAGYESWGIEYRVFIGDPGQSPVWAQLDEYLTRSFEYADHRRTIIACSCIDSGGHFTQEVYDFCKTREGRRIFAIKGMGGQGLPLVGRLSRNNRKKVALFPIGVDTGKELLFSRLKIEQEGPGFCHFPRELDKGYSYEYFKGLLSEKRITRYSKGRKQYQWVKEKSGARNEPLDVRNYATAALSILNVNLDTLSAQGGLNLQPRKQKRIRSKGV